MLLVISLIIVALFIYFLKDSLKKHANIYYIGAAVISIAAFVLGFLPMPLFVKNNILGIFAKGSLGTAMFAAVMYAGALPKGSRLIAPLMRIRGELSITAAILVLCHNFTYGKTYFKMLLTKPGTLSATQLTAAIISLVLIAIMLVLTATSFPAVRKKMQAKKWKQLQRMAYVFYGLMYVHIMLINIPYARLGLGTYIANVIIYSIVFLGYGAIRITKAISVNAAKAGKTYAKPAQAVMYGIAVVMCVVMTTFCFAGRKTTAIASDDDKEWEEFFNDETVAAMVKEIESSQSESEASSNAVSSEGASSEENTTENGQTENQEAAQADGSATDVNNQAPENSDSEIFASENSAAGSSGSGNSGSDNSGSAVAADTAGGGSESVNQAAQPDNSSAGGSSDSQSDSSGSNTPANTTFKADGTYTGSAACDTYNYNVTVTIVVSGDTITSVTATSEAGAEDIQYFNMANAKVPAQLLANQSTSGVDSVSGATKSSNAIKKAFYYAYKSAKR